MHTASPQQARAAALLAADGPAAYAATCTLRVTGATADALARAARDVLAACLPAVPGAPEPRLDVRLDLDPPPPRADAPPRDAPALRLDLDPPPPRADAPALRLDLDLPPQRADARTLDILARALARRLADPTAPLPDPSPYPRVAAWLRGLPAEEPAVAARWREAARAPHRFGHPLAVPADAPFRPRAHPLPPTCIPAIRRLAGALRVPPEVVALTAWAVLHARLADRPALTLGVVTDGRDHEALADLPGPLARQLPLALALPADASFAALAADVARRLADARDAQDLFDPAADDLDAQDDPPPHGRDAPTARRPDRTPIAFEAAAPLVAVHAGPVHLAGLARVAHVDRFQLKLELRDDACLLHHDLARIDPALAACLAGQLDHLLARAAADPARPLHAADLLGPDEAAWQRRVLAGPDLPAPPALLARLADVVAARPDVLAVVDPWVRLTYRELDRAADALAGALRAAHVDTVAVLTERAAAFLVAIVGAMRACATWVPLERAHPPARLRQLVARAGAVAVVHDLAGAPQAAALDLPRFALDARGRTSPELPVAPLGPPPRPDAPAYIIFTSGSTGAPKGVCVPHGALASYADGVTRALALADAPVMAAVSSLATDLAFTAVFGALVTGGTLVLCGSELPDDPDGLARFFAAAPPLDALKIVPSQLAALLAAAAVPRDILPRRRLILGGEAPDPALVDRVRALVPGLHVYNHYGPTETTVGVAAARLAPPADDLSPGTDGAPPPAYPGLRPPIGRPFARVRLHLLGPDLRPVPTGATGELYVSGDSLARGYHDDPALTAARFVPDPSAPGGRRYRTGDRARLLADGAVQLLGRDDDQVKIHGVRIELGEVEAQLRRHPRVADCAVARHPDTGGLVAWIVATAGPPLDLDLLARDLARELPRELVPPRRLLVAALPRTPSGKIDRQALIAAPLPTAATLPGAPAARDSERLLAAIWRDVLGRPEVGPHDNFFELGGDSITSITVVARARRAGLALTVRDVFDHPTLAALAAVAERTAAPPAPAALPAPDLELPLTPSQAWLGALGAPAPNFFNQALAVGLAAPPERALLERALQRVAAHHEALRLRIDLAHGRQRIAPTAAWPLRWLDLSADPDRDATLLAALAELHRDLDLAGGRLLRALVAVPGRGCPAELFLVAHHACTDAVSWRIVLEDLEHALAALEAGAAPDLPPVPTPLSQWVRALERQAADPDRDEPLAPSGAPRDPGTVGDAVTLALRIDPAPARALLRWAPALHGASALELLLGAVAQHLSRGTDRPGLLVELEGHGRAPLGALDPSRTVGWLTARYPVRLAADPRGDLGAWVAAVRDALAGAPEGGRRFGVRTWLRDDGPARARRGLRPDLAFNYLGAVAAGLQDSRFLHVRPAPGPARDPATPRSAPLELLVDHDGDALVFAWTWRSDDPAAAAHRARAHAVRDALDDLGRRLAAHDRDDVAEICELAPLQEGLLADCLAAPDAGLYVAHTALTLDGPLDPALMARAWQRVVDRHAALRTALAWEDLPRPVQIVARRAVVPLTVVDLRDRPDVDAAARDLRAAAAARLARLDVAPLIHITLARRGDVRWDMLFSRHHLVLDGWSAAIVVREVLHAYASARAGAEPDLGDGSHYPRWVRAQRPRDPAAADAFWRAELAGYEGGPLLPDPRSAPARAAARDQGRLRRELAPAVRPALTALLRRAELTPSSLAQALLALVLARAAGRDDLVFGVTTSGRALPLPGVERMVGLLVNTLPLRARLADAAPFLAWARDLQAARLRVEEHHATALRTLQRLVPRAPLLDTIVVGGNYPVDPSGADDIGGLRLAAVDLAVENSLPLTLRVPPGDDFTLELLYDRARLDDGWVARRLDDLHALAAWLVAEPDLSVAALRARLAARPAWLRAQDMSEGSCLPGASAPPGAGAPAGPSPPGTSGHAEEDMSSGPAIERDVPLAPAVRAAFAAPARCLAAAVALLAARTGDDPLVLAVAAPEPRLARLPAAPRETFAALERRLADLLADPAHPAAPAAAPLAILVAGDAPLGPPGRVGRVLELRWHPDRRLTVALDPARLDPADLDLLVAQLGALADAAARAPAAELADLLPGDVAEPTPALDPVAPTISDALARGAARWPDRLALTADTLELTHAALDRLAGVVARGLVARGLRPGDIVGLDHPGPELLPLMHGVLRAGCTVLPLTRRDPRSPAFLADAGARLLLGAPAGAPAGLPVLDPGALLDADPPPCDLPALTPAHAAWLVYTSGSTGRPKGALVHHGAAMHYATGVAARLDAPEGARWGALAGFAVDLGYTAWLGALAVGGCVHLFPADAALDPERLAAALARAPLDYLKIVPSHLEALLDGAPDPARLLPRRGLVLGGEAMTWALVDRVRALAPACAVFNHYGPTETTVGVLAGRVDRDLARGPRPPLGAPLPGVRVDLLDARGRPVPKGSPGDLYVGGPTVGLGYHRRPDATAAVFVPDPRGPAGARLYRTGDRARRQPDGRLVFLGRGDDQLKIRGHRVEPAEVEAALSRLTGVRQVRVVLAADAPARLLAYAVADGPARPPAELLGQLAERLPAHMLPADLIWLPALPRTVGGKLDRRALPTAAPPAPVAAPTELGPETAALLPIWEAVLERHGLGPDDNFFASGGDSLRAIQLTSRLRTAFQARIPVQLVFENPTPAGLARALLALPEADRIRRVARVLARVRALSGGRP